MNELAKEIVEEIVETADEIVKMKNRTDYENGQLIAYASTLSMIRDFVGADSLNEIGLDFDIDERYLVERDSTR